MPPAARPAVGGAMKKTTTAQYMFITVYRRFRISHRLFRIIGIVAILTKFKDISMHVI